jgi:hypothetical protein
LRLVNIKVIRTHFECIRHGFSERRLADAPIFEGEATSRFVQRFA